MTTITNIFIGVIAGVLSYVVVGVTANIFRQIVIPWVQTIIYKGHRIDGEWYGYKADVSPTGEYHQREESESTISLKQQGNRIIGERLVTMQPNGEKTRKLFQLEGSFVDTILVLTSKVKDSNNMGTGTLVMKLSEEGKKLKGRHTYISSQDWSTVATNDLVWVRKV